MEYPDKTITMDMTAWEPTEWGNEWAIDIYGTSGSLHDVPDFPVAELYLRKLRNGFQSWYCQDETEFPHGTSNVPTCYRKQFKNLFARVRGMKEVELENGCCGLKRNVTILKIIAALHCTKVDSGLQSRLDLLNVNEVTSQE